MDRGEAAESEASCFNYGPCPTDRTGQNYAAGRFRSMGGTVPHTATMRGWIDQ
jgi:hypothetical protein